MLGHVFVCHRPFYFDAQHKKTVSRSDPDEPTHAKCLIKVSGCPLTMAAKSDLKTLLQQIRLVDFPRSQGSHEMNY